MKTSIPALEPQEISTEASPIATLAIAQLDAVIGGVSTGEVATACAYGTTEACSKATNSYFTGDYRGATNNSGYAGGGSFGAAPLPGYNPGGGGSDFNGSRY